MKIIFFQHIVGYLAWLNCQCTCPQHLYPSYFVLSIYFFLLILSAASRLLECTPVAIIGQSVCICIELLWTAAFCWLPPGAIQEKSEAQTKDKCKNPGPVMARAPHTNPKLMEQQEWAEQKPPCKRASERIREEQHLSFSHNHVFPAMHYWLGCIIHGSVIRPKERCSILLSLSSLGKALLRLIPGCWPCRPSQSHLSLIKILLLRRQGRCLENWRVFLWRINDSDTPVHKRTPSHQAHLPQISTHPPTSSSNFISDS